MVIRLLCEPSTILGILHVFPLQAQKGISRFSKGSIVWGKKTTIFPQALTSVFSP